MALDTTVGGASSDSYASVAEADDYFTNKRGLHTEYSGAGDWLHASTVTAHKEASLRAATRLIDKLYNFNWPRADDTQALKAPFDSAETDDGIAIANTTIPLDIKYAECEIARAILLDVARIEDQEIGLASLGVDVISLAFDKYDRPAILPPMAKIFLGDYATPKPIASGNAREVRRA